MTDSLALARPGPVRGNDRSAALLARSARVIVGAVTSTKRKIDPALCPRRAQGAIVEDHDGNRYLDFHAAYGAIVIGHRDPQVDRRVQELTADLDATGIGVTELEVQVAERLVQHVPCAELVQLCTTGSEATAAAVRLARAATGATKVLKFEGHYHGHSDQFLLNTFTAPDQVGSRNPSSAGIPPAALESTLVCPFNDLDALLDVLDRDGDDLAAIIVEPYAHNSPSIAPAPDFLATLRQVCTDRGIVLIFDEVITGFRHGLAGYQGHCGVTPDLATFGKAIANGYPCAAIAGRRDLMELFNTTPHGTVWYAGTHNGNPVGLAGALATIELMETEPVHDHLFDLGEYMRRGLQESADALDVPAMVPGFGGIFGGPLWMRPPLRRYDDVSRHDGDFAIAFYRQLIRRGVLTVPERLARHHISYRHTRADISWALDMAHDALRATLAERGLPRTSSGV